MKVLRGIGELNYSIPHAVVTIGNFDGVHLGHQKIIQLAVEKARSRNGTCVAYTFRPHPQVALRPGAYLPLLQTYDEKLESLSAHGVDITVEEPFSREFSTIEPDQFFKKVLLEKLKAEVIVVGYDFAFGRERHGHLKILEEFCKKSGVELIVVQPQQAEETVVSSSKIRSFLQNGEVDAAHHLLGHPFFYRGIVIKGEGRGRLLGFPTANLKLENKLVLPFGVYTTWAIWNGKKIPSVTNIGVRPTFQSTDQELPALVETHLLDTTLDLYGTPLEVQFISRLRAEKRFSGMDALKAQIALDVAEARRILTNSARPLTII
jgi:riboflavin kinase/FMN adenylyltransferase